MNMINYELQSVIIERKKMPGEFEDEFEALRILENIYKKAKDNPCLKVKLEKCIVIVQELLCKYTKYLVQKNEAFETKNLTSDLKINEMFKVIL